MTVTVSVFWIVMLVVIVHTILQHLINWGWRYAEDEGIPLMFFGTALEFFALILTLLLTLKATG